jgi:hypothetical protein
MAMLIKAKIWGVNPDFKGALTALNLADFDTLMVSSKFGLPFKTKPFLELYRICTQTDRDYFLKRSLPRPFMAVLRDMVRWVRRGKPAHTEAFYVYEAAQTLHSSGIPAMKIVAWGEERWLSLWPHQGFVLAEEVKGEEALEIFRCGTPSERLTLLRDVGEFLGQLHCKGLFVENRLIDLIYHRHGQDDCPADQPKLTLIDLDFKGITLKQQAFDVSQAAKYLGRSHYLALRCGDRINRSELLALMRSYRRELSRHGIQLPPAFLKKVVAETRHNLRSHYRSAALMELFPLAPQDINDDGTPLFQPEPAQVDGGHGSLSLQP